MSALSKFVHSKPSENPVLFDRTWKVTALNSELSYNSPLRWRKPVMVRVECYQGDLFAPDVPFDFIDKVFAVMALCPQHTFQILTKRPERMAEYLLWTSPAALNDVERVPHTRATEVQAAFTDAIAQHLYPDPRVKNESLGPKYCPWPLPNVWLGTSVENQQAADERIPHLLKCPAAIRFLSAEPLLGAINLPTWRCESCGSVGTEDQTIGMGRCNRCGHELDGGHDDIGYGRWLHWVIVGGESGHRARSCDVRWIRRIIAQCKAAGVACFVKQLGARIQVANDSSMEWPRQGDEWIDLNPDQQVNYQGEEMEIRLESPKGGDPDEWPEDLRVRQMPAEVSAAP